MTNRPSARVFCREIRVDDLQSLETLLHRGFPERTRQDLALALRRLSAHSTPEGYPRYGYVLQAGDTLVGVILTIFSTVVVNGVPSIRGNVANWYVDPEFRSYGSLLTSRALSYRDATYLNITPAKHTWPILEAQGYQRLCTGVVAAVPAVTTVGSPAKVRKFDESFRTEGGLSAFEVKLLSDHAGYGCASVVCGEGGDEHPFVFSPRRWTRWHAVPLPFVVLAHTRSVEDFVHFAAPLGRYLLRRGIPLVFIDANGPIPGLRGRYLDWGPKFYRGANKPSLGDIAYTERVMFNL
ncbi:MAG TPA: hypothetical protein VN600_04225 [Gemmatimonadaceae bacterium]|nr:hypothetical protein [Gemmatimonadaceae bacterium]